MKNNLKAAMELLRKLAFCMVDNDHPASGGLQGGQ